MAIKNKKKQHVAHSEDACQRIPVVFRNEEDKHIALRAKHCIERKIGHSLTWAALVRYCLEQQLRACENETCK